jgi:hypothetical protein
MKLIIYLKREMCVHAQNIAIKTQFSDVKLSVSVLRNDMHLCTITVKSRERERVRKGNFYYVYECE